jgi:hypothetical protein
LEPAHLTFRGQNKTATPVDDLTFASVDDRTAITYRAEITFHGFAKLAGHRQLPPAPAVR